MQLPYVNMQLTSAVGDLLAGSTRARGELLAASDLQERTAASRARPCTPLWSSTARPCTLGSSSTDNATVADMSMQAQLCLAWFKRYTQLSNATALYVNMQAHSMSYWGYWAARVLFQTLSLTCRARHCKLTLTQNVPVRLE